jgi:hypothetical protein
MLLLRVNVEEPTQWATAKPSSSTPRNAARMRVSRLEPTPERRGNGSRTDGCDALSWSRRPLLRPKRRRADAGAM